LLAKAIKYSPDGGTVRFDLFFIQEEVIFRIQDEGIGIPEADQENLFTSFQRGGNVGKIPGNGLGLAIVKHYVDLHGGEINFASKVGVGTTFIVNLPIYNN
jgi:signal transduction histidine kinase